MFTNVFRLLNCIIWPNKGTPKRTTPHNITGAVDILVTYDVLVTGINAEMKEAVLEVDPTLIITVDDDLIGVELSGGKITVKNTFKLEEEFDANTGDVPAKVWGNITV